MFWYKGWLETKFKLLLMLGCMVFYLVVFYLMRANAAPPGARPASVFALTATTFAVLLYTWLAGAGINTQPSFQATKGLHGSTLFTLSLPVSRLRLLTVRATIGWLEMAGAIFAWCYGCWLILPVVRGSVSAVDMLEYVVALIVCASSLLFLICVTGLPRRPVADVGHLDGFGRAMDARHSCPLTCLCEHRSSHYGRVFASHRTHHAVDGHAVLARVGGRLLSCGDEDRTTAGILTRLICSCGSVVRF